MSIKINNKSIGSDEPVYFIADIASNHGGDLIKAKELIHACSESKVDAVKMQNFNADTIVSDFGFRNLQNITTHQSTWEESVYNSYKAASIPFEWTLELKQLSEDLGMDYFTSPYSLEIVKAVAPYVSAFKLGSGDITWHEEIAEMSKHNKPVLIATGASNLQEVKLAVSAALQENAQILLMQCNTNYTAAKEEDVELTKNRFSNINLKVLETYRNLWPNIPVGLSDHTHGDLTVLAAVGLFDCCAVEKHFTLDSSQQGQDHSFSMMPDEWLSMVNNTAKLKNQMKKEMEFSERIEQIKSIAQDGQFLKLILGDGIKEVSDNEKNTVIVQRRSIRAKREMKAGELLTREALVVLRPCPEDAFAPYEMKDLLGHVLNRDIPQGDYIKKTDLS